MLNMTIEAKSQLSTWTYLDIGHLSHPFLSLPLELVFGTLRTDWPIPKMQRYFVISQTRWHPELPHDIPRMRKDVRRDSRLRSSNITRPTVSNYSVPYVTSLALSLWFYWEVVKYKLQIWRLVLYVVQVDPSNLCWHQNKSSSTELRHNFQFGVNKSY